MDVFSTPNTSIFIVYAHDNEEAGVANAKHVVDIIERLQVIRSRVISDKAPLLLYHSLNQDSNPARNILDNQFRLLPACGSHDSVNTVVIFGSEVLRQYYVHKFTVPYIDKIREIYDQATPDKLRDEIRSFVESQCQQPGFHHVLTELAFLQIRRDRPQNHGIIPVVLSGDDVRYLPFIESCNVFLKTPSKLGMFFKLLQKIFTNSGDQEVIKAITNSYEKLEGRQEITDNDIDTEIANGLATIHGDRSADGRRRLHSSPDNDSKLLN